MAFTERAQLLAEFMGTGTLLCTVIGSGIMTDMLSNGNGGVALFGNTLPPAAILFVLITTLRPVSGAQFNPAVTLTFVLLGEIAVPKALRFVLAQIAGGILGTMLANYMFELDIFQISGNEHFGPAQWTGELVATLGLLLTILTCQRFKPDAIPASVALYVTAAIWFTSSTCFANPAVSIGRIFSDSYAGICPRDAALFALVQLATVFIALPLSRVLLEEK
ncbi:aquaporin [uncultured Cohaesibacter sp.]|uniref:aquaporin n=1 Tax=uncultured Cohaesibacter sp. TaxID=1002546 RepID=UPI00292FDB18|nr:aquaporin [uncultured Cohaesibacter sp.]